MSDLRQSDNAEARQPTPNDSSPPTRKSITRRQFLGTSATAFAGTFLAAGGAGAFLAACSSGGGASGASPSGSSANGASPSSGSSANGGSGSGEVVVMGWSVYMTPEIQQQCKEATGLTMRAIPADDDQSMFTKLKAGGGSQYDLVMANCGWSPTYQENDLIETINLDEIKAAGDLYPIFKEDTSLPYVTARNQVLLYPNMWSAAPMMWNKTLIQPSTPISWNALWDAPKGKVLLHGAPDDFIAMSGLALGVPLKEIYAMKGDQLQAATDHLIKLKPYQTSPNSDAITAQAIGTGKAQIGFVSSFGVAYKANNEFTGGKDIVVAQIPQEGTLGWVDGLQLVKGAKNRDNALAFLNFFGGYVPTQDYLWDQYFFAQCSKVSTERHLARGGTDEKFIKAIGANTPELATQLEFLRPPDDPAAWAKAWDQVIAS